ncbi:MAG: helix-turn-helix domain-containing protein [Spirochaetales bacterium]|nr:helix-turn-helix domain-containing protein [Spirochaetales bacterium]
MEQIKIATTDVSKQQRSELWYEAVNLSHLGWALNEDNNEINGFIHTRGTEKFKISYCRCSDPCSGSRSSHQIGKEDFAYYSILTVQKGCETISRRGEDQEITSGDIYLWDSSEALSFQSFTSIEKRTLFVEKDFMEKLFPQIGQMVGKVFNGKHGLGPFIHSNLTTLSSQLDLIDDNSVSLITDTTLELLTTWLNRLHPSSVSDYRMKLYNEILSYIKQNLDDSKLTPREIAMTFNMSLRSLHSLFSSCGTSISKMIREMRLEQCRQEILLYSDSGKTITEIALRWGFNDPAHFSKCFKAVYKMSPSHYLSSQFK